MRDWSDGRWNVWILYLVFVVLIYSFDVCHTEVAVGGVIRRLSPDHWNGKLHTSELAREPSF